MTSLNNLLWCGFVGSRNFSNIISNTTRTIAIISFAVCSKFELSIHEIMCACNDPQNCISYQNTYSLTQPSIHGPDIMYQFKIFWSRAWNGDIHSIGQSFHVNEASIFCTSRKHFFHFVKSLPHQWSSKEKMRPSKCFYHCKHVLWLGFMTSWGSFYRWRLYFITCCNSLASFIFKWPCFVCSIPLTRHVCGFFFKDCTDCWMSYMYNKYGLYRVRGEHNVLMMYFKYYDNVIQPL